MRVSYGGGHKGVSRLKFASKAMNLFWQPDHLAQQPNPTYTRTRLLCLRRRCLMVYQLHALCARPPPTHHSPDSNPPNLEACWIVHFVIWYLSLISVPRLSQPATKIFHFRGPPHQTVLCHGEKGWKVLRKPNLGHPKFRSDVHLSMHFCEIQNMFQPISWGS